MEHTLPALPYAMDALAPHISKETLEFHYGKHHAAYLNNLNGQIAGKPLEQLPSVHDVRAGIAEGGQHRFDNIGCENCAWTPHAVATGGSTTGNLTPDCAHAPVDRWWHRSTCAPTDRCSAVPPLLRRS